MVRYGNGQVWYERQSVINKPSRAQMQQGTQVIPQLAKRDIHASNGFARILCESGDIFLVSPRYTSKHLPALDASTKQ